MIFGIQVLDQDAFVRKLGNHGARARMIAEALQGVAQVIKLGAETGSPVGATGRYAASWASDLDAIPFLGAGVVVAHAGNTAEYSRAIESGRRAGAPMPPPDALGGWMSAMGIEADPFVIARSIGRSGISARPVLGEAIERTRTVWLALVSATVGQLLRRS